MTSGEDVTPLRVGDVYAWLSENGHFPVVLEDQNDLKEREIKLDENYPLQLEDRVPGRWCRICGLDVTAHPLDNVWKEENPSQDVDMKKPVNTGNMSFSHPKSINRCHIIPVELQTASFPLFDIRRIISGQYEQMNAHSPIVKYGIYPAKALVAVGDPLLTASIFRIVKVLGLKHFALLDATCNVIPGHGKMDVERNLAPFALLAVIAKLFIRLLVERGLEIVTRDKKNGASFSSKYQKKCNGRLSSGTTSMLTPTHILSGIVSCGRELGNVRWCLARLGVDVSEDVSSEEIRIKMEE